MVRRGFRKIHSVTVRKMMLWSHYKFRQRLKQKGELLGCRVHEVSEHYTSKTCGRCGQIHWTLGGRKVFKCPHCHWKLDRDFNGARNIFIKNIGQFIGIVQKSHCLTEQWVGDTSEKELSFSAATTK
jgi:putative transposase